MPVVVIDYKITNNLDNFTPDKTSYMNRPFLTVLLSLLTVLPIFSAPTADAASRKEPRELHFADTLKSPNKRAQFLKAVELAPSVFVYRDFKRLDDNTVAVYGLKFNDSMKNTLNCEIVEEDPGLGKRLRRVNKVTKPLNGVVDLIVSYHTVPKGIAVSYTIKNISLFGMGKVPEEYQKE